MDEELNQDGLSIGGEDPGDFQIVPDAMTHFIELTALSLIKMDNLEPDERTSTYVRNCTAFHIESVASTGRVTPVVARLLQVLFETLEESLDYYQNQNEPD